MEILGDQNNFAQKEVTVLLIFGCLSALWGPVGGGCLQNKCLEQTLDNKKKGQSFCLFTVCCVFPE